MKFRKLCSIILAAVFVLMTPVGILAETTEENTFDLTEQLEEEYEEKDEEVLTENEIPQQEPTQVPMEESEQSEEDFNLDEEETETKAIPQDNSRKPTVTTAPTPEEGNPAESEDTLETENTGVLGEMANNQVQAATGKATSQCFYTSSSVKFGDINSDGRINSLDLLMIQRHISAAKSSSVKKSHPDWILSGTKRTAADVNGDGTVSITDQLLMSRHIAGMIKINTIRYRAYNSTYSAPYIYESGKANTYEKFPYTSRYGYYLKGWYTSSSGGSRLSTSSSVKNYDHTIYAQWSANSYLVTYNANGGRVVSGGTYYRQYETYGQHYRLYNSVSRTSYRFDGWYTAKSGGTKIMTSTKMTKAYSHTLYAHWTKISKIALNYTSLDLQKGKSTTAIKIKTATPSTEKIKSAKSSNTSVATVKVSNGVLTVAGKKTGKSTITITSTNGATAKVVINVKTKVNAVKLTLNRSTLSLKKGYSSRLTASITPVTATNGVTWSSSNKSVASVSSAGTVKGLKAGKTKITAKTSNGKKATCTVTVTEEMKLGTPTIYSWKKTADTSWNTTGGDGVEYTVSWSKVNGASGYQVYYSERDIDAEQNGGAWYTRSIFTTATSFKTQFASYPNHIKAKVRAYKYSGGTKVYGPWSSEVSKKCEWSTDTTLAKNAYEEFLSQKQIKWYDQYYPTDVLKFAAADFNNDGVPELYVYNPKAFSYQCNYRIYKYRNNQVKEVYSFGSGPALEKYYPSKGVFQDVGGRMSEYYTKYVYMDKNGNCQTKLCEKRIVTSTTRYEYFLGDVSGTKISKNQFLQKKNDLLGTASAKTVSLVSNTSANREKYLG